MFQKAKLISLSFGSGVLLLLMLCLGSQNLNNRYSINLGISKSEPLPSGFLIGLSIIFGAISGGNCVALFIPDKETLDI